MVEAEVFTAVALVVTVAGWGDSATAAAFGGAAASEDSVTAPGVLAAASTIMDFVTAPSSAASEDSVTAPGVLAAASTIMDFVTAPSSAASATPGTVGDLRSA